MKHPELMIRQGEPIPFLSFDDECFYRQWALDIGQESFVACLIWARSTLL